MTTVFAPYLHGPLVPYPIPDHPGFHPDYGRGGGGPFGGPVRQQQQQGAGRHRQPSNPHSNPHTRPKKTIAKQQQHGAAPSLNQLKHENRRRARRHFKGHYGAATPSLRSVLRAPPAPENHNSFLTHASASSLVSPSLPGTAFHVVTPNPFAPGKAWKNSYETIDKEAAELGAAAGIDMLGTNAGLISKADVGDEEWDWGDGSDPEDTHGFELHDEAADGSALAPLGGAQRCLRPEEQTAYVSQLEDQNTDLLEENLNLREKVFLLEQELRELRQLHRVSRSASHEEAVCLTEPEDEQQQRDGSVAALPTAAAAAPAATCSQDAAEGHAQPDAGAEGS